jgi:hypothetical protein
VLIVLVCDESLTRFGVGRVIFAKAGASHPLISITACAGVRCHFSWLYSARNLKSSGRIFYADRRRRFVGPIKMLSPLDSVPDCGSRPPTLCRCGNGISGYCSQRKEVRINFARDIALCASGFVQNSEHQKRSDETADESLNFATSKRWLEGR